MTDPKPATADIEQLPDDEESASLACVLSFNANDPSGAGGLGSDAVAMASVGAH
jgi:hydroxymethylpyrimidine/phosphomethylpyrimidine kinase